MAHQYVDLDTLKFILYQVHDLNSTLEASYFADHDLESVELFLNSIKDLSDQDLYPSFREMDEKPAIFKDQTIEVHPSVGTMMKKGGEMGLISAMFPYESDGFQLPASVHTAAHYIMEAANNNLPGYIGLTQGVAEILVHFGNQALNEIYVPKMAAGEWGGTMCLTEPQAGSSLADITTSARPTPEGHYQIKGQKIFISGGDHAYASNFVHLVLAKIEGGPAGTKGISLFVVPKFRPESDGQLTPNDVITTGDFQKLGQKGFCTTHLIFGENDNCRGWLVGEPHQGLKYMFRMMNGARIAVGRGGAAISMAAYQASLAYARERAQGRPVAQPEQKEPVLIIHHPDVRRMLLLQKAVSEGSLGLVLLAARYADLAATHESEAERARYQLLLELLTPMVKTYPADMGLVSVSNGLQVLGGFGFCSEYILQQYFRDIRIYSIYEGTTGIQSLDLLGRKLTMKGGQGLQLLAQEIGATLKAASQHDELRPYAEILGSKLPLTTQVVTFLMGFAMKGENERFVADATLFMEFLSTQVVAWIWLNMALHAKNDLVSGNGKYTREFYEAKIHTMKFYFKYELPKINGLAEAILNKEVLTLDGGMEIFA
ncbi:MAG: acyl-CoA dehydrogenase [Bacteroidia bacterium]|nr:acyl-CoA dehydrogenase [Bacteroidia bacterium]